MVWMTKTCDACGAVMNISSAIGTVQCEYCGTVAVLQAPEPLQPPPPPQAQPWQQPPPWQQPQKSALEEALPMLLLGGSLLGGRRGGLGGGLLGGLGRFL